MLRCAETDPLHKKNKIPVKTHNCLDTKGVDTSVGADPLRLGCADEARREGGEDDDFTITSHVGLWFTQVRVVCATQPIESFAIGALYRTHLIMTLYGIVDLPK